MHRDPHADWPDRTPLYAEDGRLLLVFSAPEDTYRGHRWADGVWRPGDVPLDEAVETARDAFAGWAVSTSDDALAGGLVAAGADVLRHARTMTHDLQDIPAQRMAPGLEAVLMDAPGLLEHAEQIGRLLFAAYPPGHPDHRHDAIDGAVETIRRVAAGEVLGPLLPTSSIAMHDGEVVGACLVVEREGWPPDGGPWVLDIFRDPEADIGGVGRALLTGSLRATAEAGLPALSLVVSDGNVRARRLYDALGFTTSGQSRTLALPTG